MATVTIDLINDTLALIGESPLTTSTGSLGKLTRSVLQTAIFRVIQETRPSFFELMMTATASNEDPFVPAIVLPDNVSEVYSVYFISNSLVTKLQSNSFAFITRGLSLGYCVVGRDVYIGSGFARPADFRLHVLNVPSLPPADDVDSGIPDAAVGAIKHTAASILCSSYLDDANASAVQRNIAQELMNVLRFSYGIASRGRTYSL